MPGRTSEFTSCQWTLPAFCSITQKPESPSGVRTSVFFSERIMSISHANSAQVGVEVKVLFKSTAEPRRKQLAEGLTDAGGIFQAEVVLPPFNGGTSAVVISAASDLGSSEIKHLVHR